MGLAFLAFPIAAVVRLAGGSEFAATVTLACGIPLAFLGLLFKED